MPQHDYDLANQSGAAFRADLNAVLQAIVTQNSGPTPPNPTYPYQFWADTSTWILKQRNAANTAWIDVLSLTTGLPVGVIPIANGGTGATTAAAARTALGAGAANGLATLDSSTRVPAAQLGTGTADATTFLRGDRTWGAVNPNGAFRSVQIFSTAGSFTYTKPSGLVIAKIIVIGGGGGGAGANNNGGGGGGGGGSAMLFISGASIGATESVIVGSGGSGGNASSNGGSGGDSSFGSLVFATGGVGGFTGLGGGGGYGVGSGGTINIAGQGGSAGHHYNGGAGGSSILGGGASSGTPNSNGIAAAGFGGGGSGGGWSGTTNYPGGAGFRGIVIVEEYF